MNKMRHLLFILLAALVASCSNDIEQQVSYDEQNFVEFSAHFNSGTRASDTSFEYGDAISVFAIDAQTSDILNDYGNYAENVKYKYNGSEFKAEGNGITIGSSNTHGLTYYAVYPYVSNASNSFYFSAKSAQDTHANYTASDLCTAYHSATNDQHVDLEFSHKMCKVVVEFTGDNIASKNISVKLNNFYIEALVDLNSDLCTAIDELAAVTPYKSSSTEFKAIVAPQKRYPGEIAMTIQINGSSYNLLLAKEIDFVSGYEKRFVIQIANGRITERYGKLQTYYLY